MDIQTLNDKAKEYFDKKEFQKALDLLNIPNLPTELRGNLAKCYYYTHRADKALEIMLGLEKDQNAWIDTALYYNALGHSDKSYEIYTKLDQNDPKVKFNLGYHLLERDQFLKGFEYTEHGTKLRAWGSEYVLFEQNAIDPKKRWNGKHTNHLALILEGGLGDEIIFLRWADYLKSKCNKLTIFCHQSLLRLLTNSGYDAEPYDLIKHYQYDHYAPSMCLPAICKLNDPKENVTLPYINSFVEPYITKQLDQVARGKLKIGIKWFGNPEFEHDQFRTVPSKALKDLAKYGQLFSFQFEDTDPTIPNLKEIIKDWQDTYSVLKSLDVLVTSCTSIAHMAGVIGVKTFVFVPLVPYFTWASDNLRWYDDNVVVIRQTEYNNWDKPIERLNNELSRFCRL